MGTEDALFRAIRPTAETLWRERLRSGQVIDYEELAAEALAEFRNLIDLTEHALSLRARLKSFLERLAKSDTVAPS